MNSSTDHRETAVGTTQYHSKQGRSNTIDDEDDSLGDEYELEQAQSLLQKAEAIDPKAGNTVVSNLNETLRSNAVSLI